MERYIEQLVEDLREAKHKTRPPKMILPTNLEFVRGVEEYLHGEQYEMGKLFGIEKKQFPPIEKLTTKQIQILTNELIKLWLEFKFIPDFPKKLPLKYKYKLLVDYLEEKTTCTSQEHLHFDFCTYDIDSCPLPEDFCTCKDFELDDDDLDMSNVDYDDDANPF